MNPESATPAFEPAPAFASTHWSVVLLAGQEPSAQSAAALEALCRAYWYPLYAFVRSEGHAPEAALDPTQEHGKLQLLSAPSLAESDAKP